MLERAKYMIVCPKCKRESKVEESCWTVCVNCGHEFPSVRIADPDRKTEERLALEALINFIYEGKRVSLGPDFEDPIPYTLEIGDEHTHCSYALDGVTDRQHAVDLAVQSLIQHLLLKGGLTFWKKEE